MKPIYLLWASFAAFISMPGYGQNAYESFPPEFQLQKLTWEECQTPSFFRYIRNGTGVYQYIAADGAVLTVGDTLVLNIPRGSVALTDALIYDETIYHARTNTRAQYSTILMGRPAGFGNVMNALYGMQPAYAPGDMQGRRVVIAEMRVRHDGGRRKPLELVILLGEINGRAFGINKYLSTVDYETSALLGELRPLHAPPTRSEALTRLKEARELFDLELMDEAEYNKLKNDLSPLILSGN